MFFVSIVSCNVDIVLIVTILNVYFSFVFRAFSLNLNAGEVDNQGFQQPVNAVMADNNELC